MMDAMDANRILHFELLSPDAPKRQAARANGVESAKSSVGASYRAAKPEKLMRLLSDRNVTLLKLIKSAEPQSLSELSKLSGRPKASLTRTLRRLSSLGIVSFRKSKTGRGKAPVVDCDRLRLDLPLGPSK
jgi:predicted transcriptional regulator